MKEVIHIEFDMDNDEEVQLKNANDGKTEGKVQVIKKMIHYYEFSSEDESGKQAELKKIKNPKTITKIQGKMMNLTKLLSPRK